MKTLVLDVIEIDLGLPGDLVTIYINVYDSNLSRKWLLALNELITKDYHLEKNYCFFGFPDGLRNGEYLVEQINNSIAAINSADLGYHIDDQFSLNTVLDNNQRLVQSHFNRLHVYFEDLQGVSGHMSEYYNRANANTRWHIRQLNLLCHEFESWALSNRKKHTAPEWMRPSQLMCWLNAPRFELTNDDYEMFGIETINRPLGGVYVGVNKAIGKHHWEVFVDEAGYNPNSIIDNLTTTTMRGQMEAAGDFDIEWANNPGNYVWQKRHLSDFEQWLINNGFDPADKSLTIGHPQVGQVDLQRSFGTEDYREIWHQLEQHLNVLSIRTSTSTIVYNYNWNDSDYAEQQIRKLT
jgi:hypothetical protein